MTMMPTQQAIAEQPSQRTLFTVKEFVRLPEFDFMTESSVRHMIFNSRSHYSSGGEEVKGNGLSESGAIVRIGRKVLINAQKFREWMLAQSG